MYGLSRDAVEDVAREGLACCVHMELEVCLVSRFCKAEIIQPALSYRTINCVIPGCAQSEEELLSASIHPTHPHPGGELH